MGKEIYIDERHGILLTRRNNRRIQDVPYGVVLMRLIVEYDKDGYIDVVFNGGDYKILNVIKRYNIIWFNEKNWPTITKPEYTKPMSHAKELSEEESEQFMKDNLELFL